MIVASRAACRQPEHRLAEVLDRVIDRQIELALSLTETPRVRDVARGRKFLGTILVVLVRHQVAGELLAQELVERLVLLH